MWKLDLASTYVNLQKYLYPISMRAIPQCDIGILEIFKLNLSVVGAHQKVSSFHQVERDIRILLRAPWAMCHFTLVQIDSESGEPMYKDGEGKPVPVALADGTPITSDTFRGWVQNEEFKTGISPTDQACEMTPKDWMALYPTWTDPDGTEHTTDFFTDYFKSRNARHVAGVEDVYQNIGSGELHYEKAIWFRIWPFVKVYKASDGTSKVISVPAVTGDAPSDDFSLDKTLSKVTSGGWEGFVSAAQVGQEFDDAVANAAKCYYSFLKGRWNVCFNMKDLPRERGYSKIDYGVSVDLTIGPVRQAGWHNYISFSLDSNRSLNGLSTVHLDWSPYMAVRGLLANNGCTYLHPQTLGKPISDHVPPEVKQAMYQVQSLTKKIGENLFAQDAQVEKHADVVQAYDKLHGKTKDMMALLGSTTHNADWKRSEGWLCLEEAHQHQNKLLVAMSDRDIPSIADATALRQSWENIDIKGARAAAEYHAIHQSKHLKMRRPLHKYRSETVTQMQREHVELLEIKSTETSNVAVILGLSLFGLVAVGVLATVILYNKEKKTGNIQ